MNVVAQSRRRPFIAGFTVGAICSILATVGLFNLIVWMAVPSSGKDPEELLRIIEAAAPDAPAITDIDFMIYAGMPSVDILHTEGERSLTLSLYRSNSHYFEVVTDANQQIVLIHYFTGEARGSRERIFVYDKEEYEWLLFHSSLVSFSQPD